MPNIAFAVIFLDPSCHTAKTIHTSLLCEKKYFSFLFLMEILREESSF